MDPRPIMRMRVKQAKMLWTEPCFESKAQSHQLYNGKVKKVLTIPSVSKKMSNML